MAADPRPTSPIDPRQPVLTATELRQVAEWAHSVRGSDMCMVVSRPIGGRLTVVPTPSSKAGNLGPDYLVIPVDTTNRVDDRETIGEMRLTLTDGTPREEGGSGEKKKDREVDLFALCRTKYHCVPDAIFWTESSVEKFLVPYYASVHSSDDDLGTEMQNIADIFDGKFKSKETDPETDGPVTVYAMLHLPKSEYVASPPEESTLGVLYSRGEATVPTVERLLLPVPGEQAAPGRAGRA